MPLQLSYITQENRLDLRFEGNLDVTLSQPICDICRTVPSDLTCCIIDLTEIKRVFDSGVALLQKLHRRFVELGTIVVILSDHPRIRELFPAVTRRPLHPVAEQPSFCFGHPARTNPNPV
jgi:ABC-type transporter Mla MlaB component